MADTSVPGEGTDTGDITLTPIEGGNITHLGKSTLSVHSSADFSPTAEIDGLLVPVKAAH